MLWTSTAEVPLTAKRSWRTTTFSNAMSCQVRWQLISTPPPRRSVPLSKACATGGCSLSRAASRLDVSIQAIRLGVSWGRGDGLRPSRLERNHSPVKSKEAVATGKAKCDYFFFATAFACPHARFCGHPKEERAGKKASTAATKSPTRTYRVLAAKRKGHPHQSLSPLFSFFSLCLLPSLSCCHLGCFVLGWRDGWPLNVCPSHAMYFLSLPSLDCMRVIVPSSTSVEQSEGVGGPNRCPA